MEKLRLGIDFGTTYSCVGVWKDGGVEIIPNGLGERTTPSVVIFDSPEKVYVGEETLNHLSKKDSVKIYEIKRLIGKRYNEIEDILQYFPFKVIKEENGNRPLIQIKFDNGQILDYYPELIASLIIKKLIMNANSFLNQTVNEIIITVPADFNDTQRNAVKFAAESIQGIKVIQIINEPSAAVLSYGFPKTLLQNCLFPFNQNYSLLIEDKNKKNYHPMEEMFSNNNESQETGENENLLDFSLKTSFMEKDKTVIVFDFGGGTYDVSLIEISESIFETRASAGDQHLGGGDFDNQLMEYCLNDFSNKNRIPKEDIKKNYKCMQRLKIACERSKKMLSTKDEDTIYIEDFYNEEILNCSITRARFEYICKKYFDKLIPPLDKILNDTHMKNTDINEIILVGGSSKIPKIKQILKEKFPNVSINESMNPDEAVAFGATIYAESLKRNTGEFWEDFEYLDSTQHSYGVETQNGEMEIILKRGSKYPTSRTQYFFNAYDDQYTFEIRVFEGESDLVCNNLFLTSFTLEDIPKKPKGQLALEITFSIDVNQILNVTAFVGEGGAKREIQVNKKNELNETMPLKLGNISLLGDDYKKEEKKFKEEIFLYSKNFQNIKKDIDKYKLIQNYNNIVNSYLKFLEEKCDDIESEKYLFLVEKLFKSYGYLFKTHLNSMVDLNEKGKIKKNVEYYLSKISIKNPFRLKQLLTVFIDIKIDKSDIFYTSSIFSIQLLKEKGDKYYLKKQKNTLQIAKIFYEECLIIGKPFEKDNVIFLLNIEISREYNDIIKECQNNIKIISSSLSEIENTKQTGKLFSNNQNFDDDNLSLLSFNLTENVKNLNNINDLKDNKEALESKSICLANIVKIEFLKKKPILNLQHFLDMAEESIKIADQLGNICTNKEWYKEIIELQEEIKKKMKDYTPAPSIGEMEKIRQEFKDNFDNGKENFIRFLLTKYPYEGCQFSEEMLKEYKENERNFLKKLLQKYKKDNKTGINNINIKKKELIIEYLNNCINELS